MHEIKRSILKLINKLFHKNSYYISALPPSQVETTIKDFINGGFIKELERTLNNSIDITELDTFYDKKLGNEKSIYNMPLDSKLSKMQSIELAKQFFSSLGTDLSKNAIQVIENKSNKFKFIFEEYGNSLDNRGNPREAEVSNFSEVYCPRKGDLRDLYSIVHEVTHTFDLENGDTEARKVFGEIAPQCMERMLDEYLLNLDDRDLLRYGLNKNTLIQDVKNRQISTFLSRKDNIRSFNNGTGNKELDLRYILAQIYSFSFMKQDKKTKINSLNSFIKNISNNEFSSCSKSFSVDFKNKLKTQLLMSEIINDVKNTHSQTTTLEKSNLDKINSINKAKEITQNQDSTSSNAKKFDNENYK